MSLLRPEIEMLRQNGITKVALPYITDSNVIPLWFGEGDMVTPEFIRDAAKAALDDGKTFYCHTRGTQDLRDAIKSYLDALYHLDIDPDRISVPGSAMIGITISAHMVLTTGGHGLIVSPNWPNIDIAFRVTGAEVDYVRQRETAEGWQLGAAEIIAAVKPNTRAIFINSPCNPTGWIMSFEDQQELLEFCRQRDILIIADEVYHRLVYEPFKGNDSKDVRLLSPSFLSIARDDDPVIVVNGFSKAWAMTGWRVGWVVAPSRLATHWAILAESFNTGVTAFVQPGAVAALRGGEPVIAGLRRQYKAGRDLVMDVLGNHSAIEISSPRGAFYAFPRLKGLKSSLEFVKGVLKEEKVGIAPGYTFGPGNESRFRICFAHSHDRLQEGLGRIVRFIDRSQGYN
jgi:aspartate/methionine/tyrosine aminotransferase